MANEKRLIYLEDAKEALIGWETDPTDEEIKWTLDKLPKVNAVPVVHGRWIVDKEHLKATCSECGKILRFSDEMQIAFLNDEERFCYYCGAKMDGRNEDA